MLTRAVLMSMLAAGCSIISFAAAGEPDQAGTSHSKDLYVIRVFTLEGIELREAMTLVRRETDLRMVVIVPARSAMVVADLADKVAQSQELLAQRGAQVRAIEPHAPLYLEAPDKSPAETRAFRMQSDSMDSAVTLLRAIYGMREVNKSEADFLLTARAAPSLLDASEALFRELHLLAEPAVGSKSP
ncbi:MAG: hypothetical protein ACREAA_19985 [Candidatus Polarisedimenticolia bacterium]